MDPVITYLRFSTQRQERSGPRIEAQRAAIGALVQARALAAYAEVEIEAGHYRGRSGQLVGLALAQSVTRLSMAAIQ